MQTVSQEVIQKGQLVLEYKNLHVIWKYCRENEVSETDAHLHFREMLKFMYACTVSKTPLTPSQALDEMWHTFVLFTRDYEKFCKTVLGSFVHHVPDTDTKLETKQQNAAQYEKAYNLCTAIFGKLPEFMWHNPKDAKKLQLAADCCGGCHSCAGDCYGCSSD